MESGKTLVYFDSSDQLQLDPDGLNVFTSIPDDYGIIPVAAIGPGRIGKSSLLNQLIGKNSFGVGSTTSRVTQGIWVDKTLDHHKKLATVYIDVEGFGDPKRTNASSNDNRLMLVICQICDVIMYNTNGVYDSEMISKLMYRRQNQVLSVPILVTIFRDFDLDIPESPDNELRELLLKETEGASAMRSFRCIKAFTFVKPTRRTKLRELQNMIDKELEPEYVAERNKMQTFFRAETKPLCTHRNSRITGTVLAEALLKTVQAVNDDNLDRMTQTFTDLLQKQNQRLIQESVNKYDTQVKQEWSSVSQPEPIHHRCQNSVKESLQKQLFDIDGNTYSLLQQFESYQREQEVRNRMIRRREDILENERDAARRLEEYRREQEQARQQREEVERERQRIIIAAEEMRRRRDAENQTELLT